MGEIVEMMLGGELCECCGEYLGPGDGFPRRCRGCDSHEDRPRKPKSPRKETEVEIISLKQKVKERQMPKCRKCGAEIIFMTTPGGKQMPVNAKTVLYWPAEGGKYRVIRSNGQTIAASFTPPEGCDDPPRRGYISHFATCPEADRFRKRRK